MLPTKNFPKKFLQFVWNHDTWRYAVVPDPYTTIFCLPEFPINIWKSVPPDKLGLIKVSRDTWLPRRKKRWLDASKPPAEIFIYKRSKKKHFCVAYVSINELEPFYDEQDESDSLIQRSKNLKVNFTIMI
ncbi:uncharacterized protein Dana_GF26934 [Drosophila ananassae]|uniref:Uncharacterized protein n=2 Tax=Drosophila ananassae TaxID=7217 RepID=A0A0P8XGA2_DROAN|nr:uncharacterized protein Dana_GF26934 [Drosophila ananassae]